MHTYTQRILLHLLLVAIGHVFAGEVRVLNKPCRLIIKGSKDDTEKKVSCRIGGDKGFVTAKLKEIPEWLATHILDGKIGRESYLHANGATILPGDKTLVFPEEAMAATEETDGYYVEHRKGTRSNRSVTGTRTVLVVPFIFNDGETTATDAQLRRSFFSESSGQVSLKSQMQACSHNQVLIEPANGPSTSGVNVDNGVYRLTIDHDVDGVDMNVLEDVVWEAAMAHFGDLEQYDHVAFVLPSESTCGGDEWGAYAYYDDYDAYYNDAKAKYIGWVMHETGHNLNLGHSGQGDCEYEDESSYMGYSYDWPNWPQMCYNGPKSVQLGWFQDREVSLTSKSPDWSGDLYGMADYSSTSSSNKMIVYIETNSKKKNYLYVTYNKATGANVDTQEGADQVLVHSKKKGLYSWNYSYLEAILSVGETYTDSKTKIPITFVSEGSNFASVVIGDGGGGGGGDDCPTSEVKKDKFYWKSITKNGKLKHKAKTCKWLQKQSSSKQDQYCSMDEGKGKWSAAKDVCERTCCLLYASR